MTRDHMKEKNRIKRKSQMLNILVSSTVDSCPTLAIITTIHLQCRALLTWHLQVASSCNTVTLPIKVYMSFRKGIHTVN